MAPVVLLGKAALGMALPLLGSLALNKVGGALATKGRKAVTQNQTPVAGDGYHMTNKGKWVGGKIASFGGAALRGAGNLFLSGVVPAVLSATGGVAKTAGNTGGALVAAGSRIPAHLANIGRSQKQKEVYGNTIFDAVGDISSDLGAAAGVGLASAGNAIGDTFQGTGDFIKLLGMRQSRGDWIVSSMRRLIDKGLTPSQAKDVVLREMISERFSG